MMRKSLTFIPRNALISQETDVVAQAFKLQNELEEQLRLGLGAMDQIQKVQAWRRRANLEREKLERQASQEVL